MKESKKELISYLENITLLVLGLFVALFPVVFLSVTTDSFVLPKQILLIIATALFVILFAVKSIVEGKLKLRNSPFDIPVVIFAVVCFLSAFFSINRYDAYIAFVPFLFLVFLYFGIVNIVREQKQLLFILASLVIGGVLSALISILSFFKVYPLFFLPYTHIQYFSTFGALLDQAIYFALLLPVAGFFAYSFFASMGSRKKVSSPFQTPQEAKKNSFVPLVFTVSFIILFIGLIVTVILFLKPGQSPIILPFPIAMQIAFASISQDAANVMKSFFLGSGIGTFINDFTRYKPASYNMDPNLWAFTFFRSQSYVLEILSTTGVLGLVAFLFLIFRIIKEKNFFLPVICAVIAAFILPFSFTIITLFFTLLAIFAVVRILDAPEKFSEMELYLVALKKGLFRMQTEGEHVTQKEKQYSRILPWIFLVVMIAIVGYPTYLAGTYIASDFVFQQSLVAASQNKAQDMYNLQANSMKIFPYRDIYYRAFSQTNLTLANGLALNAQKSGSASAQQQQLIISLIQQAITTARGAATVAPLTSFNWNNLSSIYRSLIGFGQNADQFTVITLQQAIALDPNNPQQFVELGGVYYQLGNYDEAMRQFQQAIKLKQDYANAYYNLGHALEQKGDYQNALAMYQTVRQLVAKDENNVKKVDSDIAALNTKIADKGKEQNQQAAASPSANMQPQEQINQPLDVNTAPAQLPEKNPRVKIPGPSDTPTPAKSESKNNRTSR